MQIFRDMSIRRKQVMIIMLTSTVALLLACTAFIGYDVFSFRTELVGKVSVLAEVVGNNCTAAIDFNDPKSAEDTLQALRAESSVIFACVYNRDGTVFALYHREGAAAFTPPPKPATGHNFVGNELRMFRPITLRGEQIGTVFLASDLTELKQRLARYPGIVGLMFAASLLVALLLSSRLQRLVSNPILHLAGVARSVALDKNYSIRATKQTNDELGQLIEGFNEMLSQIQQRDNALQTARDNLEHRVEERTRELAGSLSLLGATLESTADGILVVDLQKRITSFNRKFLTMWQLSPKPLGSDADEMLAEAINRLKHPEAFAARIRELHGQPDAENHDLVEFKDGRVFELYSQPQRLDSRCVGRVWSFHDITERRRAEAELKATHAELVQTSRRAGMAEVATNVLHNVGNVLNSVSTSASVVMDQLHSSHFSGMSRVADLLKKHQSDLAAFLLQENTAERLTTYLTGLAEYFEAERTKALNEIQELVKNIEHVKKIVAMQQSYSRVFGVMEIESLPALVEDALRIHEAALARLGVRVLRQFEPTPAILVDKHKVLQILINLISNAQHALAGATTAAERQLAIQVRPDGNDRLLISITDNGIGIERENLTRIFSYGFTTRKDGHGFGLHSGALAAREMGGSLSVHSEGLGRGASFTLQLPVSRKEKHENDRHN